MIGDKGDLTDCVVWICPKENYVIVRKWERKMKKVFTLILISAVITLGAGMRLSYAGEVDILLRKLVEKGILSAGEAQEIKTETQEQVKKEIASGRSATLPAWIQTMSMKGDFRLRYQFNHSKTINNLTNERHRGRIRLRLGIDSKVNDQLQVAVGLATGRDAGLSLNGDSTRSTNQTFEDSFSKKPINLDYAYAKYSPLPWASLIGGKMKLDSVIWEPGDLIWDTDITPEGAALNIDKTLMVGETKLPLFAKVGLYPLDEVSGSGDDPVLYVAQAGFNGIALTDTISAKPAIAYMYSSTKKDTLETSSSTNSSPRNDFGMFSPALELSIKNPFKALQVPMLDIPYLALFGEYVQNTHTIIKDKSESGFMAGVKFGAEKVAGWKDWQVRYNYARLERDAVLDILPDSDRYGGATSVRGHELMIDFGIAKNQWLSLDIYRSQRIPYTGATTKAPETLVQLDWNMKF